MLTPVERVHLRYV